MMPSTSQKQHNFMAAVANNPAFAKKAGVPQSVGEEFTKADKGKKFGSGGTRVDRQAINQPKTDHGEMALFKQGGHMATKMGKPMMKPGMSTAKDGMKKPTPMAKTAMPGAMMGMKKGGESKAMVKKEVSFMKAKGAPKSMVKHEEAEMKGMKKGGKTMKYAAGGLAAGHKDADGVASKGKTKAKQITMKSGGMSKRYC